MPTRNKTRPDKRPIAIYSHGLNTFGDDQLHLGPVRLGNMALHVHAALEMRGVRLISINGIGDGPPETQAQEVIDQIQQNPQIPDGAAVALVGNSLGGITNRVVASVLKHDPSQNLKNICISKLISWGSPHRGARAADLADEILEKIPSLSRTIASFGYDFAKRHRETFSFYSPATMDRFNEKYPMHSAAPEVSFVCALPLSRVSPWFWPLYPYVHGLSPIAFARTLADRHNTHAPSDGFISIGSQNWGERKGPYELDHFTQIGFFEIQPIPAWRLRAQSEFERLCDDIATEIVSK